MAPAVPSLEPAPTTDLEGARELDDQGAKSFAEGRYREALTYFGEAWRRGAPSQELWNMARCQSKLDAPEAAASLLEQYLSDPRLSAADRAEGKRALGELQRRASRVTILSSPPGAVVYLSPRRNAPLGRTPMTVDLAAGPHELLVEWPGGASKVQQIDARWGQGVIVDIAQK
jgi:hypothetical protein